MSGRVRQFLWRHQRRLALSYAGLVALSWLAFLGLAFAAPRSLDMSAAVASRTLAYHATFGEVRTARRELEEGRIDIARQRLEVFLAARRHVQRSQLETHAVAEAYELLSAIQLKRKRYGRAVRLLADLTRRLPRHYRAWYLRGVAEKAASRLDEAGRSLRQAFLLTLNHPQVSEEYLSVLADRTDFEEILWVDDQYRRAELRAGPTATVKVGVPRGSLQRRAMSWIGLPIEQGRFFRSFERRHLGRGPRQVIRAPKELFTKWPSSEDRLTVQVRFEHIYGDWTVDALRCITAGGEVREVPLEQERVRYVHQPHSGREAYAEFDLDLDPRPWTGLEIVYSCPEHELSEAARAIIEKARANLGTGGG